MKRQTKNRIPIRFVDEDGGNAPPDVSENEPSSPEEPDSISDPGAGEADRYFIDKDAADMTRRVDYGLESGNEGKRGPADNEDVASTFDLGDVPGTHKSRTATVSSSENQNLTSDEVSGDSRMPGLSQQPGVASGPAFAELLATRSELGRVEADLRKAAAERQDAIDRLTRTQADFENYRKRVERERGETYNRVLGEIVGRLLPVTDNLRRALDAQSSMQTNDSAEFRHFLQGIGLINKQLSGLLESLGVETVVTVGQPFDPHIHEAAATEQTDRFPPDTVIEEVIPGYVLGGKLLRPAIVKVATR